MIFLLQFDSLHKCLNIVLTLLFFIHLVVGDFIGVFFLTSLLFLLLIQSHRRFRLCLETETLFLFVFLGTCTWLTALLGSIFARLVLVVILIFVFLVFFFGVLLILVFFFIFFVVLIFFFFLFILLRIISLWPLFLRFLFRNLRELNLLKCYPRNIEIVQDCNWEIFEFTDDVDKIVNAFDEIAIESGDTEDAELNGALWWFSIFYRWEYSSILLFIFPFFIWKLESYLDAMTYSKAIVVLKEDLAEIVILNIGEDLWALMDFFVELHVDTLRNFAPQKHLFGHSILWNMSCCMAMGQSSASRNGFNVVFFKCNLLGHAGIPILPLHLNVCQFLDSQSSIVDETPWIYLSRLSHGHAELVSAGNLLHGTSLIKMRTKLRLCRLVEERDLNGLWWVVEALQLQRMLIASWNHGVGQAQLTKLVRTKRVQFAGSRQDEQVVSTNSQWTYPLCDIDHLWDTIDQILINRTVIVLLILNLWPEVSAHDKSISICSDKRADSRVGFDINNLRVKQGQNDAGVLHDRPPFIFTFLELLKANMFKVNAPVGIQLFLPLL